MKNPFKRNKANLDYLKVENLGDRDQDRQLEVHLEKAIDIRSRIEKERDVSRTRLERLRLERDRMQRDIDVRIADHADIEKIIAGMEAHIEAITEGEVVTMEDHVMKSVSIDASHASLGGEL